MSNHGQKCLFLGSFVHSKSLDELEFLHNAAAFVDEKGVIVAVEQNSDLKKAEETIYPKLGWSGGEVSVRAAELGQFFFPGFIGQYQSLFSRLSLISSRHAHPRPSVPQCRHIWQDDSARLA